VKGETGSLADLLRPVLDTYRDSALAVVGCRSADIARESCEIDAVVVSDERRRATSFRLGTGFCDLGFVTEKESLSPADPETALSLAQAKVVRDSGLILSTSVAANQAVMARRAAQASQLRLTACLKSLSRADEALAKRSRRDASFWVLSSAYDFARSWLYSMEVIPSPSHLLAQLKEHSKGGRASFEAFAGGAGLGIASRRVCGDRLEGLSLLHDLLPGTRTAAVSPGAGAPGVAFMIIRSKAEQLSSLREHAEGYSFLGLEVVNAVLAVGRGRRSPGWGDLLSSMSGEGGGLLSGRLVRELGLERPLAEAETATLELKDRAAKLARRI
jgi:hypothetical protein